MNGWVYLIGLLGGAAASLLLRYPFYSIIPSLFVSDWAVPDKNIALLMLAGGGLIILITGGFASLFGGVKGTMEGMAIGAVAGFIAALIPLAFWVAPAAGIWGAREAFWQGLKPFGNDLASEILTVKVVISLAIPVNAAALIMFMAGALLGSLGGLLAGPGGKRSSLLFNVWPAVSIFGIAAFALVRILVFTISSILVDAIVSVVSDIDYAFPLPGFIIFWVPSAILFVLFFSGM